MPKQGTLVLVPFPFTDLSATKVRPALVISSKALGADVILSFISSRQKQGAHNVAISPSEKNGLKMPSVVVCSKIATLEKTVILGELGTLEEKSMKQVKSTLALIFNC